MHSSALSCWIQNLHSCRFVIRISRVIGKSVNRMLNRCVQEAGHSHRWCPGIFLHRPLHSSGVIFSLFIVHSRRGRMASQRSRPSSVRKYSTLGGISENASRPTNPSRRRTASVSVRVFGLIPASSFESSLNRMRGRLPSTWMIKSAHFLEIVSITPSSGQMHATLLSQAIVTILV